MSYLDTLNERQRQAVKQIEGPVLIMAGAGSGKTKALTCRIAYMLEQGIRPQNIRAITFTNKAAQEMRERVHHLVGAEADKLWMYTFHSFGARFLRRARFYRRDDRNEHPCRRENIRPRRFQRRRQYLYAFSAARRENTSPAIRHSGALERGRTADGKRSYVRQL